LRIERPRAALARERSIYRPAVLPAWVRLLDAIGAPAPLGVEVLSDALRALPPDEAARRACRAMRALLGAARA